MNNLENFDKQFGKVIGVDEAGRGPLAGPVVAAAVIIKDSSGLEEVNDSKKICAKKREKLYEIIIQNCEVSVGIVENNEIDRINILNATMKAMKDAVIKLNKDILVLVDGNQKIPEIRKQQTIVKGDSKSLAIAAASIVAKVTRDRMMDECSKIYPQYLLEKHKGYGTKDHISRIVEYGPSPIHRKSFLTKILQS